MPAPFTWTPALETRLRQMRLEGATWQEIADILGVGRESVREHGRRIGAVRLPRQVAVDPDPPASSGSRPPLAAGHPVSWGLLTEATLLQGSAYPYPVFQ